MELEITAMSNEIERLNRMTPSSMSARHALNLEELTEAKNKLLSAWFKAVYLTERMEDMRPAP